MPPSRIEADVLRLIGNMLDFSLVQPEGETGGAGEMSLDDPQGA